MNNIFEQAQEFISRRGVFVCESCDYSSKTFEARIQHTLGASAPVEELNALEQRVGKTLTPMHRRLLSLWNGCVLFSQSPPQSLLARILSLMKRNREIVGCYIYSTHDLPLMNAEIIQMNIQELETLLDDPYPKVVEDIKDDLENWIPNLLIIGEELCSSNYLAMDYRKTNEAGEHPIVFLNHELVYMGSEDREIIAESLGHMLQMIMEDPSEFLNETLSGVTCYSDGETDEQWFPVEYKLQ